MSTYYSTPPANLESLQPNDAILFNNNTTFSNPAIQELVRSGTVESYIDPITKAATGVRVIKPYLRQGTITPPPAPSPEQIIQDASPIKLNLNQLIPSSFSDPYSINATSAQNSIQSSLDAQRAYINQQSDLQRQMINAQYGQNIQDLKDVGNRAEGTLNRILGQAGGFTTTAGGMALTAQSNQLAQNIGRLESAQNQALAQVELARSSGNMAAMQEANKRLDTLQSQLKQEYSDRVNLYLKILGMQNDEKQTQVTNDINTLKLLTDIPAGQEVVIGGTIYKGLQPKEGFFTAASWTDLVKNIPMGETRIVSDPYGNKYTVSGIGEDKSMKYVNTTDDKGYEHLLTYDLSNPQFPRLLSDVRSLNPVGKTKTQPANITLNLREQTNQGLTNAQTSLLQSIGSDGYWNTATYEAERNKFGATTGGDFKAFDDAFKNRLNPSDPTARRFLTKGEVDLAQPSGLTAKDKEYLKSLGIDQATIDMADAAGLSIKDLLGQ